MFSETTIYGKYKNNLPEKALLKGQGGKEHLHLFICQMLLSKVADKQNKIESE